MSGRRLFFVRHGEYDTTSDDIPLTNNGREQARKAGRALAELGMQGAVVLTSSANRAKQSAEEIAGQINGSGPYESEDLWFKAMVPHAIVNLDDFLSSIAVAAGEDSSRSIVAVTHAELISALPGNRKSLASVAFCEMVEYIPGTWTAPSR